MRHVFEFVTDWGREGRKKPHRSEGIRVFTGRTRGIAAGSSRAAESFVAQTAFRIFRHAGTRWTAGAAEHTNHCFDTEAGSPDCVKLGY